MGDVIKLSRPFEALIAGSSRSSRSQPSAENTRAEPSALSGTCTQTSDRPPLIDVTGDLNGCCVWIGSHPYATGRTLSNAGRIAAALKVLSDLGALPNMEKAR